MLRTGRGAGWGLTCQAGIQERLRGRHRRNRPMLGPMAGGFPLLRRQPLKLERLEGRCGEDVRGIKRREEESLVRYEAGIRVESDTMARIFRHSSRCAGQHLEIGVYKCDWNEYS